MPSWNIGGADQQEGQEAGNKDGQSGGEDKVDGALEDLVEELLDVGQDECNQHDGQHGTLVTRLLNLQTEKVPVLHRVGAFSTRQRCCDVVAVHQGRGNHCGTHGQTEVGVTTEDLGGGEADQHGQESEGSCGEQVDDVCKVSPLGMHCNEALGTKDTLRSQHAVDCHQHTATDQHRDERHEDVSTRCATDLWSTLALLCLGHHRMMLCEWGGVTCLHVHVMYMSYV